jgi:hypothetical protein
MRDVLGRSLILLPSLQPSLTKRLALLLALDKLRHGFAQHPVRGAGPRIRKPLEAVAGVLIELHGDGSDGVHAGDSR